MNNISTIIFDIGNVLVEFCWQKAISNMNLSEDVENRLVKATIKSSTWDEFDRGVLTEEEIHAEFIRNDPEIREIIDDFWDNYYYDIVKKFDYADELIDNIIKQGYKVYFLSNFSEMGFRVLADQLDFVQKGDGAVVSYREKLIKPDPKIYEVLINRYAINPQEAVFIDDTLVNIEEAKKHGLNTIHFTGINQALSELEALGVSVELSSLSLA